MSKKLSLKEFFEAIETNLNSCTKEELFSILWQMAKITPPERRNDFLLSLKSPRREDIKSLLNEDTLLIEIEDFIIQYKHAMDNERGLEEYHCQNYRDDDGGPGFYESYVESLEDLFDRTAGIFDYGDFQLAYSAYKKLFTVFEEQDDYGGGISFYDLGNLDRYATICRYIRAQYENNDFIGRSEDFFKLVLNQVNANLSRKNVKIVDIINAHKALFPKKDLFLKEWKTFLSSQKSREADEFLREAVQLTEGIDGLERLARSEGLKRPKVYLNWALALEADGRYLDAKNAANEALDALPILVAVRTTIADTLYRSAQKLGDNKQLIRARWQAFISEPSLRRLLDLYEDAQPLERGGLIQKAHQYLIEWFDMEKKHQKPHTEEVFDDDARYIKKDSLIYVHILTGNFLAAKEATDDNKSSGWNSLDNPMGIVFSVFLFFLANDINNPPPKIKSIWSENLQTSINNFDFGDQAEFYREILEKACLESFRKAPFSAQEQETFLNWCLKTADHCIEEIVSKKQRGIYALAAMLTAVCAEVLNSRGQKENSLHLVAEVRDKYRQFSAFRKELDVATLGK